ncbi:MAG: efflux RND transporter periplasmic adaptor subunit [Acidobacteriota bacterium]
MRRPNFFGRGCAPGRTATYRALGTLLLALPIVLSVGCGGPKTTLADNAAASSAPTGATLTVAVVPAENVAVEASVRVTGSFVAKEISDVAPETGGKVIQTPVDVGDFVQQGQVIARLEDRDAKLRLDQAEAAEQQAEAGLRQAQSRIGLAQGEQFNADTVPEVLSAKANADSAAAQARLAEADAQRYANLLKTGDVSQSAYDKFRTQADTAQAQANAARQQYEATLNAARQNFHGTVSAQASLAGIEAQGAMARKAVADTIVHAPFAGYISARPIAAGQYVGVTSKIATLLRITPIRLELQVPEVNSPDIKLSVAVEAMVPGYPGRTFQGRVTAINPAVDPSSRTITVIAEFPNSDIALKPGMFATARILLAGDTMGLFVPRDSVITDPTTNSSQVYFIRDGRARVAVVQLGATRNDSVQILSGLSPGAVIATDHLADLFDGLVVKTVPTAGASQATPAPTGTKTGTKGR